MSDEQRWAILEGDCMVHLRDLEAESVDLIPTDPPYGIGYVSKSATMKVKAVANDERPFIWFLHDAYRVLKDPGALVCFCRWDVQEVFRVAIAAAGFSIRAQLVWDRVVHGTGDTQGAPAPQHDVAWFAVKGAFKFPAGRLKSVLRVQKPHPSAAVHPTEKPVQLLIDLVEALSPRGGLVYDPFCGSGSAGVAALRCGCRFLGSELEPRHARVARERLAAEGQLFGG